jgi:hypothetical protein
MKRAHDILIVPSFIAIGLMLMIMALSAPVNAQDKPVGPKTISHGVFLGETPPLRDLPAISGNEEESEEERDFEEIEEHNPDLATRSYPYAEKALPKGPDPAWQKTMGSRSEERAPQQSFNGSSTTTSYPTDANGTIGPNHYMQTINSVYTIFNRAGTILAGPSNINLMFFGQSGADCNDGDPIVLYDEMADRWVLAEFSICGANDYMLIAVSTTNDPTGTWYKYSFDVGDVPDYEKIGIWPDGYYMGTNTTAASSNDMYVFERSQMLTGGTPQFLGWDNPWRPGSGTNFFVAPPLDNDGTAAPNGEPGLFIAFNDDAVGGGTDQLWIYEMDADWATPANSTFTRIQQIDVASFDSNFGTDMSNITQQGSSQKLDAVPQVIMNPPQYRNFGTYETILCCHSVDVDNTDHAGIRWYELRRVNSGDWTIRQQGTYAPDGNSRWMGSIMLNAAGEIGLGYSISSSTLYPGICFCGQSSTAYAAANSTLDVAEDLILSGNTSQSSYARWGDYSSLQIDPTDDETFWYTNQYIETTQARKTKVANFQIGTPVLSANFAANSIYPQIYNIVNLTDVSYGNPNTWSWSISPASYYYTGGTTSTSKEPKIQFTAAGDYTISMTVTNNSGSDTETKTSYIHVLDCAISNLPFTEDFSDGIIPACWKNIDNAGNGQVWLFNNPGGWTINTTTGANGVAICDSYYYGGSYIQNADLISPLLDLSAYTAVTLYFQYYIPYYSPNPTGNYGRLSYSIDDGATWTNPGAWAWYNSANPSTFNTVVTSYVAGQSRVRFKWNYTGHGYFWAIDDISITGTGPSVWTGTTSTDWAITTNWSTGVVPGSTSNVIIPASATNWPTYTGNMVVGTTCNKLTIYGAGQLSVTGNMTINGGKTIEMKGNGQINVGGSWSNNGYFLPGTSTVNFTGSTATSVSTVTNNIANTILTTGLKGMTELTGSSTITLGNDVGANVSIGFSFNYLGTSYSNVRVCDNGWLSFTTSGNVTSNANANLFTSTTPNLTLAPWFDDLNDDATAVVSYKLDGTSPYRVFTVEWKSMPTYSSGTTARISFQVKLFETTNIIEFLYGELVNGTHSGSESASIGIENSSGGSGNFIEATTGSTTTGVTTLVSTTQWPAVNYWFYPPATKQVFCNLTSSKTTNPLTLSINTQVKGNFTISSGTLAGLAAGTLEVLGNWTNNGAYTQTTSAVIFNGISNQNIGGTTATTLYNLTINNPSGITLQNNLTTSNTLTMNSGNINAGSYILELGTSAAATGTLSWTSGNILGNFKRWIAASTATAIDFPVGTITSSNKARITFTNNTAGSLTARFESGDPGSNSGFPLTENGKTINAGDQFLEGSWTLIPTTLTSTSYALELTGTGFTSGGTMDAEARILKRPDGGGAWTLNGTHVAGSPPVAKRTGLSGFSRFALAQPCSNPVTVTAGGPDAVCKSSNPSPLTLSGASVGGTATTGAWSITGINPANGGNNGTLSSTSQTATPATITYTPPADYSGSVTLTLTTNDPNGSCSAASANRTVVISAGNKISGNITYYNSANTPLTSGLTVKLFQNGSQVGSDYTVTTGSYEFNSVCPGTYEVRISSGQSTEGSVNSTDAGQANYWSVIPYEIEKVRFYAGDVTGSIYYINSTDALRIQNNFVYGTPFDKGTWVFWKAGETISSNSSPSAQYPTVTLSGSDVLANIYGLCAGDFNRSFIPSASRSGFDVTGILRTGAMQAGSNEQIDLPVSALNITTIGSLSLILDFDPELAVIEDVIINDDDEGNLDWYVDDCQLKIGWYSLHPLNISENIDFLKIKLRTTDQFINGKILNFSLVADPRNEITSNSYETVQDAMIGIDDLASDMSGMTNHEDCNDLALSAHPNPFKDHIIVIYSIPYEGNVTLDCISGIGISTKILDKERKSPGNYSLTIDNDNLLPGVYTLKLTLKSESTVLTKSIRIVKSR